MKETVELTPHDKQIIKDIMDNPKSNPFYISTSKILFLMVIMIVANVGITYMHMLTDPGGAQKADISGFYPTFFVTVFMMAAFGVMLRFVTKEMTQSVLRIKHKTIIRGSVTKVILTDMPQMVLSDGTRDMQFSIKPLLQYQAAQGSWASVT